eukprot:3099826-Heterocapsa_arctica.AAC.1
MDIDMFAGRNARTWIACYTCGVRNDGEGAQDGLRPPSGSTTSRTPSRVPLHVWALAVPGRHHVGNLFL